MVIGGYLRQWGHSFFEQFFEALFSLLKPSWDHFLMDFGRVLRVENDANKDHDKNVKSVFSPRRESKNEGSEASQEPSKIDAETCSQTC